MEKEKDEGMKGKEREEGDRLRDERNKLKGGRRQTKRWKEKDVGRKKGTNYEMEGKRGREEGGRLRDGRKKMKGGRRQTKKWKEKDEGRKETN